MKTIKQAIVAEIKHIEGRKDGSITSMLTPWAQLNAAGIAGWEWGTITTIGSMSGVGKTAFANQLVSEIDLCNPKENIEILFFTMEMAARKLVGRSISNEMGMSVRDLYTNCTDANLKEIKEKILPKYASRNINYIETPRTATHTKQQVEMYVKRDPNKKYLIIYDHTILVKKENFQTERDSLVQLLSGFNELKKVFPNTQYLLLTQLNRDIESYSRVTERATHYPKKGDLFGSDSCYQFSDIVFILHDPSKLGIQSYGRKNWKTNGYLFGHVIKARDGDPNAIIVFKNNLKNNKIREMSRTELIKEKFF